MPTGDSKIGQLRALVSDPTAQADYATTLLRPRQTRDVLLAALDVLASHPHSDARQPLLDLYDVYRRSGSARDPGAFTRRSILAALRPLATPADLPVILDAVGTYEFLPPDFKEDAILLRASALVILNEQDDVLARFHAARLLVDPYADPMSGEPSLSAVRVLASQAEYVSLYQYAMQLAGRTLPEVVSECLRNLVGMPDPLIPGVLVHFAEREEAIVQVGLVDLVLGYPDLSEVADYVADALASSTDLDAFRYLAMSLITSRNPQFIDQLLAAARFERNPHRAAILLDALDLLGPNEDAERTRERLKDLR
jgi:hypothetical protein